MLSAQEMACVECGEYDETTLELQVDRGGRIVRFRVDCDRCGVFSHYLEYNEINRAVKRYLKGVDDGSGMQRLQTGAEGPEVRPGETPRQVRTVHRQGAAGD